MAAIARLSDEEVVQALGGASLEGDKLVANFLATEALNRVQRARRVLDALPDALVATGREGRVALLNPAAESLVGWLREEVVGRPLDEVVRLDEAPDALRSPLRTGEAGSWTGVVVTPRHRVRARVRSTPLRSAGAVAGLVVLIEPEVGAPWP